MNTLENKKIAFLATDGVEQVELTEPWKAVEDSGGKPVLVSLKEGEIQAFKHHDKADTFTVDKTVTNVSVEDFAGLLLPGGVINPDSLRMDENAVQLVRDFVASGKPVAAICHGPWLLAEANCVRNLKVTSWPSVKTDLENAGAMWVDESVVTDQGITTSRKPDDLPDFCKKIVEEFSEGIHYRDLDRSLSGVQ